MPSRASLFFFLRFILNLALLSPHLANASEIESIAPEDHNHESLVVPYLLDNELDERIVRGEAYEPDFFGVDRGIVGRQTTIAPTGITNNVGTTVNITPDLPQYFVFQNSSLHSNRSGPSVKLYASSRQRSEEESIDAYLGVRDTEGEGVLEARQTSAVGLYITANTCLQPSNPNAVSGAATAPQLQLWVSTSSSNKNPGPSATAGAVQVTFDNGFANYTLNATSDVYIGVHAPNSTAFSSGAYSVQIAGSIDAPFHSYFYNEANPSPNLHLIDSDTVSALLVTDNLTSTINDPNYAAWMNMTKPPFDVFVFNQNNSATQGLTNSYCALKMLSDAEGLKVQKSMSNITEGNLPKEQFFVTGLNGSSNYYGYTVLSNTTTSSTGVIGGGGSVWQNMTFSTQSDGACSVVYNLSFCTTVAYAVPGAISERFPDSASLAAWYDNYTSFNYAFFEKAMQQIPCDIESSGQYSLAKNCTDCKTAYKAWLCSVSIPRCMDYTSTLPWLQERNVVQAFPNGTMLPPSITDAAKDSLWWNSSRNPLIDSTMTPGPYKEVLPCDDLCYGLVQSCPATLGFSCPLPGQIGFEHAYGQRPTAATAGNITCSYPGAVYGVSTASRHAIKVWLTCVGIVMVVASNII